MSDDKANVTSKSVKECMIDKVVERLHAEVADSEMYLAAAVAMEKAAGTDDKMVLGLYEMAKEEFSHAYFLREYLIDHDEHIPDECEKAYRDLEARVYRVFR